jgi:hypothetical protein
VTLLSSSAVTVSGGVTLLSASQVTISGGVTLLSSAILTLNQVSTAYAMVGCTPTWIYAALISNGNTIVWKPAATKRFNITDITISNKSASTILVTQDTAATITIANLFLQDRGGWVSNYKTPIIASETNHALVVNTSVSATNGSVTVVGYESA